MNFPESKQIAEIIGNANTIVIAQADNPDGDSLASALAMESILDSLGKTPHMYCGVNIPSYLHYFEGWDRVSKDLPDKFDLTIIVDCSTMTLFEALEKNNQTSWIATKPCIVLDHHQETTGINFASVTCNKPVVATGELIYELSKDLGWKVDHIASKMIVSSIMADSMGLITEATSARTIHIIAELVDGGVSIPELENERRKMMQKSPELIQYKGRLLQRIEYYDDTRIAMITIPFAEIEEFSPLYNPPMLIIDDMRMTEGTCIAIAFKTYNDGKITAKIRSNYGFGIASDLASHFGGGGHKYASGFKVNNKDYAELKMECIKVATELLNKL